MPLSFSIKIPFPENPTLPVELESRTIGLICVRLGEFIDLARRDTRHNVRKAVVSAS